MKQTKTDKKNYTTGNASYIRWHITERDGVRGSGSPGLSLDVHTHTRIK